VVDNPVLSVIVISQDDEDRIESSVRAVVHQQCPVPFEVIVVNSGRDRTAEIVRARFPDVQLIVLGEPALPGVARNACLRVARGEYVTYPGSHVTLRPGALAARVAAHRLGHDLVAGTWLNGTETPAGWASYFLDHSRQLAGRPSGPLDVPPASASYRRELLVALGGFPEDMRAGEDTVVNNALFAQGHTAYRVAEAAMYHHSPCRNWRILVRHHFKRGQGMGRITVADAEAADPPGLTYRELRYWLLGAVPRRVGAITRDVERWGADLRPQYRRVYPLVVLGALAAWAGLWWELVTRRRSRTARSAGRRRRSRR
jgi:glycosyltransferase involved in cell wall biosynthesis